MYLEKISRFNLDRIIINNLDRDFIQVIKSENSDLKSVDLKIDISKNNGAIKYIKDIYKY